MFNNKEEKNSFALYLLFNEKLIMNEKNISERIKRINNDKIEVSPILGLNGEEALYCNITINDENFKLVGIDSKVPEEISSYTIDCAYGKREELDDMSKHSYHIIAFYEGKSNDMMHILNLYYKLSYGFLEHGFLGLANGYSWNVVTPSLIQGMAEDEELKEFANTPAMMIYRNFLKIPHNDGVWFTTKGNNLFGVHEFAFYGDFEKTQEIYDIFEDVFYYIYESDVHIEAGHTIQLGDDVFLKFKEVYELQDTLEGEGIGTLVLEKINSDEINM